MKKVLQILLFTVISMHALLVGNALAQPTGYKYRKTITVSNTNLTGAVSGFIVPVRFDPSDMGFKNANGYDIYFSSDAAGTVALPYDREAHSGTSAVYWVRLATLSNTAATTLYMFYDNPSETANGENKSSTWSGYGGVWHFNEATENLSNAAGNYSHGTRQGTGTVGSATGRFGNALNLNAGSNRGYVQIGRNDNILFNNSPNALTIEFWVYTSYRPAETGSSIIISQGQFVTGGSGNASEIEHVNREWFYEYHGVDGRMSWWNWRNGYGPNDFTRTIAPNPSVLSNPLAWRHVVTTFNGATMRMYIDGVEVDSDPSGAIVNRDAGPLLIGQQYTNSAYGEAFKGRIDELRISKSVRNEHYVKAAYEIGNNPGRVALSGSPTDMHQIVTTSATVPATGTAGQSTAMTISLTNSYGGATGKAGNLSVVISGANAGATASTITDNGNGTYTVSYTPTKAGTDNIAITLDGSPISGSAFSSVVSAGSPAAGNSEITASPSSVTADGSIASTVMVTVKDANGNAVSGQTVTLSQNSGASSEISVASGTSSASGVVTFTVKSTKAETVTYTATISGTPAVTVTGTAQVTFTAGAPAAGTSNVTASLPSVTADGTATSEITVTVKDANGNPVSGQTVTLSQNSGAASEISAASGTSSVSGVVTFTVKSTKAEMVTYAATVGGTQITQTANVTFTAGATSQLTFSQQPPTSTEYGSNFTSDVVVRIEDQYGNLVTDAAWTVVLSLTEDPDGVAIVGTATVNAVNGIATFEDIRVNKVGTYTFTATLGSIEKGSEEFEVTAKELTVTGAAADDKEYDGDTDATLSGAALSGVVGDDDVELATPVGTFSQSAAGSDIAVTATLTLAGADKDNYSLKQPTGLTADITAKELTVTGAAADDKEYDGDTDATLSGAALAGVVGDDDVELATPVGTFSQSAAGSDIAVTATLTLAGADKDNYSLAQPTGLTADITAKELTVTGAAADDKEYDGDTDATLSGATLAGVVGDDDVELATPATGTFAQSAAGSDITVTAALTLTGDDKDNYSLAQPTDLTADITRKELTVTGAAADDKEYDGDTDATLSGAALSGVVGDDDVELATPVGAFSQSAAGSDIDVTAALTLAGADKDNYSLKQPTDLSADITAKELTVTGAAADDKEYDGDTDATLSGAMLAGVVGDDDVELATPIGTFAQSAAGSDISVTAALTLTGDDKDNYSLAQPMDLTADITRKELTVTGAAADDKEYDGDTDATLSGATLVGIVGDDDVELATPATGTFAQSAAGSDITVTATLTLTGDDKDNYRLTQPTDLTADITRKELTVTGAAADDKEYDGDTDATLSGATLAGVVGSDDVELATPIGTFAQSAAGSDITVTAALTLTGDDRDNYSLTQPTDLQADITQKNITLTLDNDPVITKVYDGTVSATLAAGNYNLSGRETEDDVTVTGTAVYDDEEVGTDKEITVDGFVLDGADKDNYNLITTEATTTGNITPGDAAAFNTNAVVPDGKAGEETTIIVAAKDAYGNLVGKGGATVEAEITGANPQSITATDNGDGTYTVTYTPTKSGVDNIAITLNGDAISGSPYVSQVEGGPLAKLEITVQPSATAQSGVVFAQQPTIAFLDAFGNASEERSTKTTIYATIKSGNGTLIGETARRLLGTAESWTYTDLAITGEVGTYELEFSITTTPATDIPTVISTEIILIAGAPDVSKTTASVPPGIAGETTAATITVRDDQGNPVTDISPDDIGVSIGGINAGAEVLDIVGNGDGTYTVTYTPMKSGVDNMAITLNGDAISGSPYSSTVSPNTAAKLVITTHPVAAASGEILTTQPVIAIQDAFGNLVTADNSTEVTVTISHGDGGELTGSTTLTASSGIVTFTDIALSGVVGRTYVLNFSASPALTTAEWKVFVTGHGAATQLELTGSVADVPSGSTGEYSVTLKDKAGNIVTTGAQSTEQITFSQQGGQGSVEGLTNVTADEGVATLVLTGEKAGEVVLVANATTPTLESNTLTVTVTVDKSALQAAIDEAEGLTETDYTPASWKPVQEALEAAQAVVDNPNATQSEIDAAEQALRDALNGLHAGNKPGAPSDVKAVGGDKQVLLTWTAPQNANGTPITDYLIQYTTDNGATWHTVDDGVSTATSATLTGLSNNTPYSFRVAALNAAGTGAFGAATAITIPSAPVRDQTEELPKPAPGKTVVIVDGKPQAVSLEVIENSYLRLSNDSFTMDLASIGINNQLIPITDIEAVIRIIRGEGASVQVKGYGFEPGTVITLYVFSEPQMLGHIPVQENGTFDGTLAIPADLELGRHTLQANGVVRNTKEERSVSVGVLVVEELTQQITFNALPEKTYGDDIIALNATASSGLPVSYHITDIQGNDTDIAEIVDGNRLRINEAGTVQVIASQSGGGFYGAAQEASRKLVIKPATLSVSVKDSERPYGEENPVFEVQYSGFVNGDTQSALDKAPVATATATSTTGGGEYSITISGGESQNYTFDYTHAVLTVLRAYQEIQFSHVAEVERNAGTIPLDVSSSSGLPVVLSLDDEQVAALNGSSLDILRVGTVTVTATQDGDVNYYPAEPVSVTIHVTDGSDFPVRVHKAVSPNGDGINEFLMIEGIRDYPENRVTIINKNGTVLYEVTGYDNTNRVFRGISTGQLQLPAGTYFYIVEIKDNGRIRAQKGYFVMRY